ncbi:rhodanese-related sulfurtransferase [Aurantimonas sp. DM33-3]|uniref:oxygen-dependent tRNA uridine(34) hydroxylase TrhO n=1 Tax=Aurantimonas sp. DM33-3 TaxID=2766955 RepID=UPI001652A364|nr:rhodanese-related sulfurtransferase [Aurantimonas sp. DM33-3]MBC6715172.1 rhodanese-related sulfurtransferase [Aurantimonas sp. DM33-3]
MSLTVATFYRFVTLDDLPALKAELAALCADTGTRGTILIAPEGINGTLAGPQDGVETMVAHLDRRCGIGRGELKFSAAEDWPFARTKVRIRPEIITMRAPEADPSRRVGTYVAPSDWNALIDDPEVLVLDTRNRYETKVGGFAGAVDPAIDSFTDFKAYVETALDPAEHRKVAMFCTGGIRCEKASAYMLSKGFESVFHLKGGILQYLEDVSQEDSRWEGDCYVFDGRVAVGHGLARTDWTACYGCGQPLSPEERADPAFEEGVSCAHCIDRLTEEKAASLRERQRQIMRETGRG